MSRTSLSNNKLDKQHLSNRSGSNNSGSTGAPARSRLQLDPNWLKTRRSLLSDIKTQVQLRLGVEPKEILLARRKLEGELKRAWTPSTKAKLLSEIAKSEIVYCGDFHAFPQAQRTQLKLLKDRASRKQPRVCLAMEAFPPKTQKHVDAYLAHQITEEQLLDRTRWNKTWGFPWENYKGLAEFARDGGHDILAIGSTAKRASLSDREAIAAKQIGNYYRKFTVKERPQMYVIFGELHLAKGLLPKRVKSELKRERPTQTTVHLNNEDVYFKLAELGLENKVDVVAYRNSRFCILASPPWVQWQSYLLYLDNALGFGVSESEFEDSDEDENADDWESDLASLVLSLARFAAQDLKVELSSGDISVYVAGNPAVWVQLKKRLNARELEVARGLIASGKSFFVPSGSLFYLTRSTINQVAELAGQYLHTRVSGLNQTLWLSSQFESRIWVVAVGFFISKLINHKRHSETLPDLQQKLQGLNQQDQSRASLMLALDQRYRELFFYHTGKRKPSRFKTKSWRAQFEAAQILGGMMGERLYLATRSRTIKVDKVLEWMRKNPMDEDFATFYENVVVQLGPGTGALRTRKERL